VSADGRVFFDGNGTRKIHAVPASTFCSAHVYHVQQSAIPHACLVLHLTFVEGWPKNPAKYWRLREAGLLAVQPEPLDQKYLSFTPPDPGIVPPERKLPDPAKSPDGKGWSVGTALLWSPRFAAHVNLIDRHIGALRNAIGIAKALGRQLVMPKMMCMCERSESPFALLPKCVLDGASTPVPHVCPLESVYDVARLERLWQSNYMKLHPWTLLNSSIHRPPPGATARGFDHKSDVVAVRWNALPNGKNSSVPPVPAGLPAPAAKEVWMGRGMSDVQIREALTSAGASNARVIHLESAEGAFGGFEDRTTAVEFHRRIMGDVLGGWSATWCCTSWDKPQGTLSFKRPIELPSGAAARGPRAVQDVPTRRTCYWTDRSDCNSA